MKTATFRARGESVTEILVYDLIGRDPFFGDGIDAKEFRQELKAVKTPVINLRINSPGGSVFAASAMMTALDEHPARIEVDVDGVAASAASVIMLAGDVVRIASTALVMIHNASGGVMGGAEDMRRTADLLDKINVQMLDRYADKAKKKTSREQMKAHLDAETWFTGAEAVAVGLADEVTGALSIAARVSPQMLPRLGWHRAAKIPAGLIAAMENPLTFEVGDCVQWMDIDAEELSAELHCGCVEEIGPEVGIPGTGLTLTGTADDPAVRVIEEDEDEDECCWYLLRASQLREAEDEDEPEVPMRPGMAAAALAAETEKRRAIAAQL